MFKYDLEVEANMMASGKIKHKLETIKRKSREENVPSTSIASSSNDAKFEMMMKKVETLMDRMVVDNRTLKREHNEPQIRNPNFRRPNLHPPPQIRQRDMRNPRNPYDQQTRPPFLENYVAYEEEVGSIEDHIHLFGELYFEIYLTKEEDSMFSQEDDINDY